MIEARKSTSASAIQVKNQRKTKSIDEKLDGISRLEKMKELLTYAFKFDSLIVACLVQFVIVLTELKKLPSQEMKCLCSKITRVLPERAVRKLWM